ncbi:unnamed protein product [Rotaria sp. Silwood2]|nr:unnamed protein product [Rotaria sp. Silwood2]
MIVDTRILPSDVLTYTDEKFYEFVHSLCGDTPVELLKVLCIRSVQLLLMTDTKDIFSVMNLDCVQLEDIKKKTCFQLQDKSFVIKPGVESSIKYLKELLLAKNNEHLKQLTTKITPSTRTIISKRSTQSLSSSSNNTITTTSTVTLEQSVPMSTDEHKQYVLQKITEWCDSNKENLSLVNLDLKENEHFTLTIKNSNTSLEGLIKCKCGVITTLATKDERFVLSNFYKHLQTNKCSMMKIIRREDQENKKNDNSKQLTATSTTPPTTPTNKSTFLLNKLLVSPSTSTTNSIETTTTMKRKNTAPSTSTKRRKK